jgi:hypothetical protein
MRDKQEACPACLLDLPACLLPVSLTSQRLLDSLLFTRLQVEGVSLDLLDNVLLLDFTLEAAKSIFQSFAVLKLDLGQTNYTSQLDQKFPAPSTEGTDIIGG